MGTLLDQFGLVYDDVVDVDDEVVDVDDEVKSLKVSPAGEATPSAGMPSPLK